MTARTARITLSVEQEAVLVRSVCLRGGEREGDGVRPIVDCRDLSTDIETTAEWLPAGTDRVYAHTNIYKLAWRVTKIPALHVCVCLSKDCLCLLAKLIQMYVAVGLRSQCHGLHFVSLCGG